MVRLYTITAVAALLFTPSLGSVAFDQAVPVTDDSTSLQVEQAIQLEDFARNATLVIEHLSHRLGRRQYASGSETPLWYTGRTDPWANFRYFNWNTWVNWGWSDHTLGYVKEWYYDEYGLNLPLGVGSWQQLSFYVTYFGTRTPDSKPFVTAYGGSNTEDPWYAPSKPTTTTTTTTTSTSASKSTSTSSSSSKASSSSAAPSASATTSSPSATSTSKSSSSSSSSTSSAAPTAAPSSSSSSASASSSSSSSVSSSSSKAASSSSSSSAGASSSSSAAQSSSSAASVSSSSSAPVSSSSSSSFSSVPSSSSSASVSTSTSSSASVSSSSSSPSSSSSSSAASAASSSSSSASSASSSTSSTAPTPTIAAAPSGWKQASTPCIAEGTSGRALLGSFSYDTAAQTVAACLARCDSLGYPLGGLEYGDQCFCSQALANSASLQKTGTCNMACPGDATSTCGGPFSLQLYVSTKFNSVGLSPDLTQATIVLPNGWQAAQADNTTTTTSLCIKEVSGRALTGASTSSASMTVEQCLSYCGSKGFQYAGLQYGRECYCDNQLNNGASLSSTSNACGMSCAGSPVQSCGGYNAMNVYANPAYSYSNTISNGYVKTACIQEVDGRALRGAAFKNASMTVDQCTSYCGSKGMRIAGVQFGAECYCSNRFDGGASLNLLSGQCYMPCGGDGNTNCGGPNAIFVFINPSPPAVGTGLPAGWSAKGCIAEPNGGRALAYDATLQISASDLTSELCATTCQKSGYTMSGVEYGSQCYCGNSLDNGASANTVSASQCNYPCPGNSATFCGGSWRLNLISADST